MGVKFKEIHTKGYERVVKVTDEDSGLVGIIAIHNTTLGPALGGTRIYPYASFDDALYDVLRLSKGMTYKSAVSEVGLGGGKSVIIADPKTEKTPEKLTAFAEALNKLKGTYIAAEDSGATTDDMATIRNTSPYVVGLASSKGSGNPSPVTAWGTYRGIQAVLKKMFGTSSIEGRIIAIQGLGSVGMFLVEHLYWAGAKLIVTDVNDDKIRLCEKKYGAKGVSTDEILGVTCDVLAPCAMGGIINSQTIPHLKCKAIAGCANNQLEKPEDAISLQKRGILYAPDFVINAGGLLNVAFELEEEGFNPVEARNRVHKIYDILMNIFKIADDGKISTFEAANSLAEYRIRYGLGKRLLEPTFHPVEDEELV